jgi:hypothetical protein
MNLRDQLGQGQASLARAGDVRPGTAADLPYVVTDDEGEPVEAVSIGDPGALQDPIGKV